MRQSKEFFLQESDVSYMNRAPIGGLIPFGGFLNNFVYFDFSNIALTDTDLLHIARNQDIQSRLQLNNNFRI